MDLSVRDRVVAWAKENAPNDYMYGAPYSWWREALTAGIINAQQFREASEHYGSLWHYRGD